MAEAQKNKSFFFLRMIGVVNQESRFIVKYRLCLLKRYSVLLPVDLILLFVPGKSNPVHNYIIIIKHFFVKQKSCKF